MPRLDNSGDMGMTFFPKFSHPTDVSKRTPIDLCQGCWRDIWFNSEEEHPSYYDADPPYKCVICNAVLTEDDDNAPAPKENNDAD